MVDEAPVRRLVLDILVPIKGPTLVSIAQKIASLPGIDGVNLTVTEIDVETITLAMVIEGEDIDFEAVKAKLRELGCVIHSVDQVLAGKRLIELPVVEEE